MPTTNTVPSTDPSDLLFNAGKLDEVVNGTANSFTDRLGAERRTVAGMNADFDAQLADAESDLNVYRADAAASAAEALGYLQTIRATSYGAYAEDPTTDPLGNPPTEGDEYWNTIAKLLKRWNGTTWQASDINTANLAASSGSSLVGYDGGTVQGTLDVLTGPSGAASIGYTPAGADAVPTTIEDKLREKVSAFNFMTEAEKLAVHLGTISVDVTIAVQKALDHAASSVGTGRFEVDLPRGRYPVTGVTLPSRVILSGAGELYPIGEGVTALTLLDTLYSAVRDISIYINAANQKGIKLYSSASYSQLNEFFNVKIDGTLPAGSVGIEINASFSNSFYGCNVLRTAKGVTFTNAANANNFYGGEIRSVNTNANCDSPVIHEATCWSNGFHGTVIENWRLPILMNGGVMMLDSGCYIEAFASASSIVMNGGDLRVIGNYLNNGFIFISGGNSISVRDNVFDGSLSNAGYPFIKYITDVATRLNCSGNEVLDPAGVLLQPRQYWTGSAFAYRAIANRREFVESKAARFQARMLADGLNVTGDATEYTILFGANEQFDDGSNFSSGTSVFTAPENGIYNFEASVNLSGITVADHNNIQLKIVTSNRSYFLFLAGTDGVSTTGGQMIVRGTALADMEAGDTAIVTILVSGTSKVVDVLRGDSVNGYTTFSGFKVA